MVSPVTASPPCACSVPLLLENVAPVIVQFWPLRSKVPEELVRLFVTVKAWLPNCKVPLPECVML